MGIDLEVADVAAARYRLEACQDAGVPCDHDPTCADALRRLLDLGPSEYPHRRYAAILRTMLETGMSYPGEPLDVPGDGWRSQTLPGRAGIPAFKLRSNDRWLVTVREIDQALRVYATVPAARREALEADPTWAGWLRWLRFARGRGGFEAE